MASETYEDRSPRLSDDAYDPDPGDAYEPQQGAHTADIAEQAALFGATPRAGDIDNRPVWVNHGEPLDFSENGPSPGPRSRGSPRHRLAPQRSIHHPRPPPPSTDPHRSSYATPPPTRASRPHDPPKLPRKDTNHPVFGRCGEDALRRAPAAALRRLGLDGPDVAVEHRLEALDDVALVGQAEADDVGEERGCVGSKRLGWLHGAVSVVPVVGNGGDALPRTSTRRPAHGQARPFAGDRHGNAATGRRTAAAGAWRQPSRPSTP